MSSDFNTALEDYIGTPKESDARSACGKILCDKISGNRYKNQCERLNKIFNETCNADPGNMKPKHFTDFYTTIPFAHTILTSVMFVI